MCQLVLPEEVGRGLAFRSIDGRMIGQRDAPFTGTRSAVWMSRSVAICRTARVELAAKEQSAC